MSLPHCQHVCVYSTSIWYTIRCDKQLPKKKKKTFCWLIKKRSPHDILQCECVERMCCWRIQWKENIAMERRSNKPSIQTKQTFHYRFHLDFPKYFTMKKFKNVHILYLHWSAWLLYDNFHICIFDWMPISLFRKHVRQYWFWCTHKKNTIVLTIIEFITWWRIWTETETTNLDSTILHMKHDCWCWNVFFNLMFLHFPIVNIIVQLLSLFLSLNFRHFGLFLIFQ